MATTATSTPAAQSLATSVQSQSNGTGTSLTGRPPVSMTDDEDEDDLDDGDDEDEDGYEVDQAEGNVAGETTIKSGYLWKKGEKRKNWKKRWFVLRASKLAYYKNEKEYQLLRLLDMSEVHTVASVELKRNSYAFGIVTPKRTYYVKASSRAEMDSWIAELTEVKTQLAMRSTLTQEMASAGLSDSVSPAGASAQAIQIPGKNLRARQVSSSPGGAHSPLLGTSASEDSGAEQFGLSYASSTSGLSGAASNIAATTGGKLATGSGGIQSHHSPSQSSAGDLSDGGRVTRAEAIRQRGARDPSSGAEVVGAGMLSSSDEDDDWDEEEKADQAMPLPDLLGVQPSSHTTQALSPGPKLPTAPGARDPNKVIMQGYLMKQSNRRKHWRKRWFVLTSTKLSYMRSHMDDRSSRQIPLSSVLDAIEYTSKKNTFVSALSPGLPTSPAGGGQMFNFGSFSDEPGSGEVTSEDKRSSAATPRPADTPAAASITDATASGTADPSSLPTTAASAPPPKAERRTSIKLPAPSSLLPGGGGGSGNASSKERETPSGSPAAVHATLSPALSPPGTPMISALKKRSKENCFRIITPKRTYVVCAPTEDEEIKWLGAIQALLTRSRGEATVTSPAPSAAPAVSASASSTRDPSDSSAIATAATPTAGAAASGAASAVEGHRGATATTPAAQDVRAGTAVEAK